jgi:hypothetical protein
MTALTRSFLLVAALALIAAGRGGATGSSAHTTATTTPNSGSGVASPATLRTAVRTAIHANLELSLYVLWNNRIPSWATSSTRGPALTSLRSAAATRRRQGIRIKNLSGQITILSITLAPSHTTATAVVRDVRRVAPYQSGRRLGKAIASTEHSRVQLHRLGNTHRFVVWRVTPVQ